MSEENLKNPQNAKIIKAEKPKKEEKPRESRDVREFKREVMMTTTGAMNPVEYAQTRKIAKDFLNSGSISKSFANEDQVLMALLAGREMGMSMMESVNDLYYVGGKLNIYGKATPSALRRHGWKIEYFDETAAAVSVKITNIKTGEEISDKFTFEEAEKSGFVKDNYGKVKVGWREGANRRRKLRYGVLSLIIHTYVPEVLGSVAGIGEYSEDYMAASADNKKQTGNAAKLDRIFMENEEKNDED